jgi:signal transduction histidine kinase
MNRQRRLGFRTRQSIVITLVFIAAGAVLLTVQFFVVQQLFAGAIRVTSMTCNTDGEEVRVPDTLGGAPTGCQVAGEAATGFGGGTAGAEPAGAVLQQSVFLSEAVGTGMLLWSAVMLVVFAAVATLLAYWLSGRSFNRIVEVTAAARDISERQLDRRLDLPGPNDEIKELGDTFDGMLDRLQLAFAAQDRFVANASHELRTPLTTTRAALEIPLKQGDVPASLKPAIQRALRATQQSETLITALLELARGRLTPEHTSVVDLAALVTAQLTELTALAAKHKVTVSSELEASEVDGDPVLLERAVRNLLENGIRHNVSGGSLAVRLAGGILEVENSGAELSPHVVSLLTEPFYRGEESRTAKGGGTGLGLAIVDSIATTHGGALRLAPRVDGGLVARLELPQTASAR